jgi:diaminopimelate epimerase
MVVCQVKEQGRSVTVEMGQVRFHSRDIPVLGPPREVIRETIEVAGQPLEFTAATIGNPHCVILRQQVSQAEATSLGPLIEIDNRFPNRTNVQFMRVLDRANIQIEIGSAEPVTRSRPAAAVAHRRRSPSGWDCAMRQSPSTCLAVHWRLKSMATSSSA